MYGIKQNMKFNFAYDTVYNYNDFYAFCGFTPSVLKLNIINIYTFPITLCITEFLRM